ncbi:MAG: FHA domain-containing protein [Solirubrobacteraceae bacterium]
MVSLRVRSGPLTGENIEIKGELVIGRENADLVIEDPEISRRHAVVRRLDRGLEVEDLGSSNGTYVDGVRIEAPTVVGGGAELKLGTSVLVVEGVLGAQATRVNAPISDPQSTKIADPQATVARSAPADLQATAARQVPADLQATVSGKAAADFQPTAPRAIPATDGPPAQAPAAPLAPPTESSQPVQQVGVFAPPSQKRTRGLASRSWIPVVLSFGTVILVAIALVIYFASR